MAAKKKSRRGIGARKKFSPFVVSKLVKAIESGLPVGTAAVSCGVGKSTFHQWRASNPVFDREIEKAQHKTIEVRLATIQNAAATDWRAAAWLLERSAPDEFAKSRVEHEHRHVHAHATFAVPPSVLKEIATARTRIEERTATNGTEKEIIDVETTIEESP